MMDFDEYQEKSVSFDVTDGGRFNEFMPHAALMGLGLTGESGEAADIIKKAWRDDGFISDERKTKLLYELGDVMWYIAILADMLDTDLSMVAQMNFEKLADRRNRNVIHGQGDNR